MKALFGSLLCLVLASSQCYALKGGPDYTGGSGVNIVGTYAGVLQGLFDPTNPASSNTIGIFTLGVPKTGNASGSFLMFARGRTFTGTINAAADPNKATLKGILNATYDFNLETVSADGTVVVVPVTATVDGPITAQGVNLPATLFTSAGVLLNGDATLYISGGRVTNAGDPVISEIVLLTVSGFKQSNTATTGG